MRSFFGKSEMYTGILTAFYSGQDIMVVVKTQKEKVFAKLDSRIPINLFHHYYAHAVMEKQNGRNVLVALDTLIKNVNVKWLKVLQESVPARFDIELEQLLYQVMMIEEPLLRDVVLEMLCDNTILTVLLTCSADCRSDPGETLFEGMARRVNTNTEVINDTPVSPLEIDCLCVVALMQKIVHHDVIKKCVQKHRQVTVTELLIQKLEALPERCQIADAVSRYLKYIVTDDDLTVYLECLRDDLNDRN